MRLESQFWLSVDASAGPYACWPWSKSRSKQGYGRIFWRGHNHNAHRIAWELSRNQPADDHKVIDHLCRNPLCCNPHHLEEVTNRENVIVRGQGPFANRSRQTHCLRGHPFDKENTYIHKSRGVRVCRACHRNYERTRSAKINEVSPR